MDLSNVVDVAGSENISVWSLALSLGLGFMLSMLMRWHFVKFGTTLSNRRELADILPFITLTTVLIITVVKSSLALSLGLVGALSIVRFRTPIKEPEELAYLFIAIATGLGLGANQWLPTVLSVPVILTLIAFVRFSKSNSGYQNLYLSIGWDGEKASEDKILEAIKKFTAICDLRRLDSYEGKVNFTCFLELKNSNDVIGLKKELVDSFPGIDVTFIDQHRVPGL